MPLSAKRILIAPLDWGLGHTTRCIPIIRAIQALGHEVLFAGDEQQQAFIRKSFPQIDVRFLKGYRVRYSRRALMFTLLWQMPRLFNTIRKEHEWLKEIVAKEGIDGIISDNRYGLWHGQIPCVIITHQPGIVTGVGAFADRLIRRTHYNRLGRFSEVWIPDQPGPENLGGKLSNPPLLPRQAQYIGWLSQFMTDADVAKQAGHIMILLSGPEPQRTMLADILWVQAKAIRKPIVFVEGKEGIVRDDIPPHIRHLSLADAKTLQPLFSGASLVVCRSGYSTLMDLATLGKPAILIPTPGQTEQEYLAASLAEKGFFYAAAQHNFSLASGIELAKSGSREGLFPKGPNDCGLMLAVLSKWIEGL